MPIKSFADNGTRDIYDGENTKAARKTLDPRLHAVAARRLTFLNEATDLRDLRGPGHSLEALKGDRKGQHSIRVNQQYRICFEWDGTDAREVEITDYH